MQQLKCLDDESIPMRQKTGGVCYTLPLEIPPHGGTLMRSLEAFVEGEVINTFRWEDDGPARRTCKTDLLWALSDVFVVHAKVGLHCCIFTKPSRAKHPTK